MKVSEFKEILDRNNIKYSEEDLQLYMSIWNTAIYGVECLNVSVDMSNHDWFMNLKNQVYDLQIDDIDDSNTSVSNEDNKNLENRLVDNTMEFKKIPKESKLTDCSSAGRVTYIEPNECPPKVKDVKKLISAGNKTDRTIYLYTIKRKDGSTVEDDTPYKFEDDKYDLRTCVTLEFDYIGQGDEVIWITINE